MRKEKEIIEKSMQKHAESTETLKRDMEKSAEQKQQEEKTAIREIYQAAGKIQALKFQKSQSKFFGLLMLKQVKDAKEYRDKCGLTWEGFCELVGANRRWVDEQLADLKPFKTEFLEDFLRFSGVTINKIKYLGEAISGGTAGINGNMITYNGETIPVDQEHADEIQALIETLEENHKKEKDETSKKIAEKERLIKDKQFLIDKQSRDLSRLERTVERTDLTEEEQEAVNLLHQVQVDIMSWFSDIKKKIKPHTAPEIALRQYYYLLIFFSKMAMDERMALHEEYKDADEVPWEISEMELPPTDVMIDNLPMTAGKGMGKKVVAKLEERKAKKNVKK